jgi:PAS domain S-box-containing protein
MASHITEGGLPPTLDPDRLAALRRAAQLDVPAEESFDRLTRLAVRVLDAPVALVSLVDEDRQFFLSQCGLPEPWASHRETPLSHSFCQHVVNGAEPLVIEDAREHPLVRDNLAIPDLGVIAYAGIPLVTQEGHVLGSFCVIDDKPRRWTGEELEILGDLARSAMTEIALRTVIASAEMDQVERQLRESEERFRLLVKATAAIVWDMPPSGEFEVEQPEWSRFTGQSFEAYRGWGWANAVHPEDRAHTAEGWRTALERRSLFEVEHRLRRHDGEYRNMMVRAVPILDPDGGVREWVGIHADVTDRRRAEVALDRERQRLQEVFARAPAVIALYHGPEHVISMVNPMWETMVGKRDVIGRRFRDVFPELEGSGLLKLLAQVYRTGEPFVGNEMLVPFDRDGDGEPEESYWNFVWQPITGLDGQVHDIMVHAVEVTDQFQARQQVEKFAAERTAILSQIAEGVIVADAEGRLTFINDVAQRIHGTLRLEVGPEEYTDTYHLFTMEGEPYPGEQLPLARALQKGETVTDALWRIRRPDGTEVIAQGNAAPVLAENGRQVASVLTLRDVTEQRLLQRQVEVERERLREVFQQAPALIAVLRGPDLVFEIANPPYLALFGDRTLVGRPIREALPELEGQGYYEMLDGVYSSGEPVIGNEMFAQLNRGGDGVLENGYFNFVFPPLREADGSVGGILIHAVEVTEQVRARKEVEQKAEELARAARALELTNRELDHSPTWRVTTSGRP